VDEAGFLHDAGEFDADFFRLTPREALAMDPQQRLFLEASWEAFEDAGIDPLSLRDSQTGVFAGVMYEDYPSDPQFAGSSVVTSNTGSIVSGRVAYLFGLVGPTMTIDTACSSSLVALHLACGALRAGECSLALAGGVTVMTQPSLFVAFSMQRGLAQDGRCKSFADSADGTNWGEGVGVLALERLSDARRLGHRVLGLIRGSAVNQDGASNGFASPNGPSQQRVIRQAVESAGLSLGDIDAVEGHGTGTRLGDPIEAQALLSTYGQGRPADRPLLLGSIKSNIGHVQAAAGVAGVIKMVQALNHETLPSTLHVDFPSRQVDWSVGAVKLLTESQPWRRSERPRRAGVSSFGISGTNAHVILEEPPETEPPAAGSRRADIEPGEAGEQDPKASEQEPGEASEHDLGAASGQELGEASEHDLGAAGKQDLPALPWLLSAKSEPALREQAERLRSHLTANPGLDPVDVAFSLATGRAQLDNRAAVVASGREQLLRGLQRLAHEEVAAGVIRGAQRSGKTAFMFTGQGAQRVGMGAELHSGFPVFAAALDEACAQLDPHLPRPLKELLFATEGSPEAALLDHTQYAQASLFALEVALFRLLQWLGMEPDMLIGHSIGEIVAAHVSGVLSLADASRLVAARGGLMGALPAGGGMLAIEASELETVANLEQFGGLSLAAVNGPRSVVVSGELKLLEDCAAVWQAEGRKTSRLRVSHAFHSKLMEPMLEQFRAVLEGLEFESPRIPVVSNLTGAPVDGAELMTVDYWVRHVREPVRFAAGVASLRAAGVTRLLEVGPEGILSAMARECLEGQGDERMLVTPTLRAKRPEAEALISFAAEAHANGMSVAWRALLAGHGGRLVGLPSYPFQRRRFWHEPWTGGADLAGAGLRSADHPLLDAILPLAGDRGWTFTGRLSPSAHPWLSDHNVLGAAILPGSGFVELALAAGRELECDLLEELTLQAPLVLPEEGHVQLQLTVGEPDDSGRRALAVYSRAGMQSGDLEDEGEWVCHAEGVLLGIELDSPDPALERLRAESWPPRGSEAIDVDSFYEGLTGIGLDYGPAFQNVEAAWRRGGEIFAEVALDRQHAEQAAHFGVHPALLDAALHAGMLGDGGDLGEGQLLLPFSLQKVRLHRAQSTRLRVSIGSAGEQRTGLCALDEAGEPVLSIGSLVARPVDAERLRSIGTRPEQLLRLGWEPVQLTSVTADPPKLVAFGELAGLGLDGKIEHRYADLRELVEAIDAGEASPEAVVASATLDAHGELLQATHAGVQRMRLLLQEWLSHRQLADLRLVLVTRGAMAVIAEETPELVAASVWGLVRSAQSEHPGRFQLLDLDPASGGAELPWSALLALDEPQLALRQSVVHVPRLQWASLPSPSTEPTAESHGTVLITGGTGGLGALVARHLAGEHRAPHLLLVSRRGARAEGARELVSELAGLGCAASIAECDVSDRDALSRLIDEIPPDRPLRAVIHTAGVVEDGLIDALGHDQLERVMRPKVDAALHLEDLTEDMQLTDFVLFSSAASAIGSPGQSNYAAANAFMDALALRRRARGLAATSLAWGMWAEGVGMTGDLDQSSMARLRRLGVAGLSAEEGLRLLDLARSSGEPLLMPARLDMETLRAHARVGALPALLRTVVGAPARRSRGGASSLAQRLSELPESERGAVVLQLVRDHVARILGYDSSERVDPDAQFQELGIDSLAAVELRNSLDQATGMRLPATLVFDHPTPTAVAKLLRSQVAGARPIASAPVRRGVATEEQIAIVGMSCRYPGGVQSPEDLWRLVSSGTDAVSAFPEDRGWDVDRIYDPDPEHLGTTYVNEGGFLYDAADFDADFFQISPREAAAMDPQQRLLLESAWEAFEAAGIDPRSLRGSQTGVFAGVMYQDYGLGGGSGNELGYAENVMPGAGGSVVSGRVSYNLGLEGPAITVDTACSSSLVALHLACQALRQDECSLALAGGVTIFSTPTVYLAFSRLRGLAADGRCKPFAASADGVGWSEGVGLVALERLSDAQRLGHPVLAVVKGSAINQDGASNGFTAPNGPSQERVILQALANAQLSAGEVDAVEAHGTGTALGDPIEAQALMATYGQDPGRQRPLWLGSVKSNFGHTQAAAGVAGAIKMVMAMRHGLLPKTLHAEEPSKHVDWSSAGVSLLTEAAPWSQAGMPRRAGVSSFGISGTNVHVILEEPPAEAAPNVAERTGVAAWVLSGRGGAALRAQAQRLHDHVAAEGPHRIEDVGFSLAGSRAAFENRAVVVGEREELLDGLQALARGELPQAVVEGEARRAGGPLAFLLTGGGAQRVGMGRELYREFPAFKEALDEVLGCFEDSLGRSLREAMVVSQDARLGGSGDEALLEGLLDKMVVTQTIAFSLEIALFRLIEHWGLRPDYLIGHSLGELVAVHVGGALSLQDACKLVAVRGRLMEALPAGGAMVAVEASEQEIAETLNGSSDRIALAAVNGPSAVVLSGDEDAVLESAAVWEGQGRKTLRIRVSHASHSHRMEGMLEELERVAAELSFSEPRIPVVSNLTGRPLSAEQLADPGYWADHVRHTVRYADGVRWLSGQGVENFLELGPDGVLSPMCMECLADDPAASDALAVPVMRRGRSETRTLLSAIGALWTRGVAFDWTALFADWDARRVALPTYAFQRRRHWLGGSLDQAPASSTRDATTATAGPLLRLLASASEQQRHEIVLEGVREQLASTLGYGSADEIDPEKNLLELGFDSVMAVELRTRLNRITALQMSMRAILDHPTALALAAHIEPQLAGLPVEHFDEQVPNGAPEVEPSSGETPAIQAGRVGTLTGMLGVANDLGSADQFMDLLATASTFRPTFDVSSAAQARPQMVRLSEGEAPIDLICVPTVLAMSGPHQYVRFARKFRDNRSVFALAVPGFKDGERLPLDLEAAIESLALAIEGRSGDDPFALVGYSSGGWLAHAVAGRLERGGGSVQAVILLDTLPPLEEGSVDVLGAILGQSFKSMQGDSYDSLSDDRLTAMGAYMRLLGEWRPGPIVAQTLLVEAGESLPGTAHDGESGGRWDIPLEVVEGIGNHFTMIEDHAHATAQAVDTWLVNAVESQGVEEVC